MFLYDTHVHSSECSKCANNTAKEMVRAYKANGFSGFVLTNHFYHGNTSIDRNLPWQEFVEPYIRAFEEAREEGAKCDFDVIFGIEEGMGHCKEFLCYDIDLDFLRQCEVLRYANPAERIAIFKEAGALLVYAHPFRFRDYMGTFVQPVLDGFEGIEVFNTGNIGDENGRALLAAGDIPVRTAGNDTHGIHMPMSAGMLFDRRVRDAAQLAQLLRAGEYRLKMIEE